MVNEGVALNKGIELRLCAPLNFLQHVFGREDLALMQRTQHEFAVGKKERVSDVEKQGGRSHEFSVKLQQLIADCAMIHGYGEAV
jgi:hypothetical protein